MHMAGDAVWRMTEDGEFILNEPYKTMLDEAKVETTRAWHKALIEYLEPRCPYTAQELTDELLERNGTRDEGKVMVFDEFVLEALSGDL
jgi:hypothetical protein